MKSVAAKLVGEWRTAKPAATEAVEQERGSRFKEATQEHPQHRDDASPTPVSTLQRRLQGGTNLNSRGYQPRPGRAFPSIDQITSHDHDQRTPLAGSRGLPASNPMENQPPLSNSWNPEEGLTWRAQTAWKLLSSPRRCLWLGPRPPKLKSDGERAPQSSNQYRGEGKQSAKLDAYSNVDLMRQQRHHNTGNERSTNLATPQASDHAATSAYEPGFITDSRRQNPTPLSEKHEHASSNTKHPDNISSRLPFNQRTPTIPDSYSYTTRQSGDEHHYPIIADPVDAAHVLSPWSLRWQRIMVCFLVFCMNAAFLIAALLSHRFGWVLAIILFMKSKDVLSTVISVVVLPIQAIYRHRHPAEEVSPKWILTLITAYLETEEEIMTTVQNVRDQDLAQHKQVMCIIQDGKPRNIKSHLLRIVKTFRRPYVTSRFVRGELIINAGFMPGNIPAIVIEKVQNAGKKDSLILCHDLFNIIREDAPLYTKLLRDEIGTTVLPALTEDPDFNGFDLIFCTDANSITHEGAIARLADAISRDESAVAACGLVLVKMERGAEWSMWHLYQQFQYTFGQYVRRRAEGLWGKVTCLPGCVTMIAVRPEMAGAIQDYAKPVTDRMVLHHQVQYLGTDRRLTFCMLSQHKKLRTLFVPSAVNETDAPQSLRHYLSQRRRWGSNAYFNDFFYSFGAKQIFITRLWAFAELLRLTLVYYRVANTILFIRGLVHYFRIIKLIPLIVVTQIPTCWYLFFIIFREPLLRSRAHKLFLGFLISKIISPFLSMIVFTIVVFNLGNHAWGATGVTTHQLEHPLISSVPEHPWTAKGLVALVRKTVKDRTSTKGFKEKSSPKSGPGNETGSQKANTAMSTLASDSNTDPREGRRSNESEVAVPSTTRYPVLSSSQDSSLHPSRIKRGNVGEEKDSIRLI